MTTASIPVAGAPLEGARIWLSGAIPESSGAAPEEQATIERFVLDFSDQVFSRGGHILHGASASLTPLLLRQAELHRRRGGRKDCLTLAVSRFFTKIPGLVPLEEWRSQCTVYVTGEANGAEARSQSLEKLREFMADRCDAFVAVGGKWWEAIPRQAGVPEEVHLALERKIPSFLLGGLGGAAKTYIAEHPEVLRRLWNGQGEETNLRMATDTDVGSLAAGVCDQLARLPLVRGRGIDGVSFRILALDGGGIKGAFTAAVLAAWEKQTGLKVVKHFDLIAGTSTGGILAIGLGLGLSAQEILEFYKKRGAEIFPVTSLASRTRRRLRHFFKPKYSLEVLHREIEKAYYKGNPPVMLRDAECRLLIPAYDTLKGVSHLFRTPHHRLLTGDSDTPAADAAMATAAAPTYFSAAKVGNMIAENKYLDGGVWANAPAMAAIVEAVCWLGVPMDRLDVLSVGTTEEPYTAEGENEAGIFGWGPGLIRLLMNAQEESSLRQAEILVRPARFLRVNVMTKPGSYRLDSPEDVEKLAALGYSEAMKPEILGQVTSRFLNGVAADPWAKFP